mmetsp:Transcript_11226/g.32549  ORF Transcript_11226/g.32549 Transcript_11226/m.32549 type:complete len:110 (+) Transcript_11226:573-902(+)
MDEMSGTEGEPLAGYPTHTSCKHELIFLISLVCVALTTHNTPTTRALSNVLIGSRSGVNGGTNTNHRDEGKEERASIHPSSQYIKQITRPPRTGKSLSFSTPSAWQPHR